MYNSTYQHKCGFPIHFHWFLGHLWFSPITLEGRASTTFQLVGIPISDAKTLSKWIINLWFPRLKYQLFGSPFISFHLEQRCIVLRFHRHFHPPVGHWWKECSVTLKPASNEDFRICSALASSVKLTASCPLKPTSWRTKTFMIPKQNETSHVLWLANWPSKDFWG